MNIDYNKLIEIHGEEYLYLIKENSEEINSEEIKRYIEERTIDNLIDYAIMDKGNKVGILLITKKLYI